MKIELEIPEQRISNLLCNAFEGGSNYWYMIDRKIKPKKADLFRSSEDHIYPHLDYPLSKGGGLVISTTEDDEIAGKSEWTLDLESIAKGCKLMAEKHSRHFGDWMSENDDSTTGDVFLQLCLFGEVIYG